MLTPSAPMLPWLAVFSTALTAPTFHHFLTLFCGTVLTAGPRTVTAALQVLGQQTGNFSKFHRVFNRARWSPMRLSRLLLRTLVARFLAPDAPALLLVDETLERRRARHLAFRGLFRDGVRSTAEGVQFTWGVRWLCLALLVPVPWSRRPWALPFLAVPLLSEPACRRLNKPHRTLVTQLQLLLPHVRAWLPEREVVLVGDGAYAAVSLAEQCAQLTAPTTLVTRGRLDAVLHDPPEPPPPGKRGPKPKKGARQPKLADRLTDPALDWQRVEVPWYAGHRRQLEWVSRTALWYRPGHTPVPIRWVLVRTPAADPQPLAPTAYFCTRPEATPAEIVGWVVARWNLEVTFAEVREHLGFETQRHWSTPAVGRVIPCLFGCFSLVVLLARELHPTELPLPRTAWYHKEEASFGDALAAVRRYLWAALTPPPGPPRRPNYGPVPAEAQMHLIPASVWRQLQQIILYAH